MVPLPVQGHSNQLLHLSRLLSTHALPVHFVGTATLIRQVKTRVHGWDPSSSAAMHFHEFPTPEFENPPPNPNPPSSRFPTHLGPPVIAAATSLRQPVYELVTKLSTEYKKVVIIFDFYMSCTIQDTRLIENTIAYRFLCAPAFTNFSFYWENESEPPEFIEYTIQQLQSRTNFFGDIYDTSRVIEPVYIEMIEKRKSSGAQQVWALGPLNPVSIPDTKTRHECLDWLDRQEPDSVIFISFGTTVSVTNEEIEAIALGLEKSEQKFIWVLRDADTANVFTDGVRKLTDILPLGFEKKVKDRGLILTDWAPQLEILAHEATGGFMSHCGWNSCSESITMGVPIAAWPMHSDQPRNAFFITEGLRIGVEVVSWERRNEKVSSDIVEKAVRKLMASEEGEEIRKRAKELGVAVRESFKEGGVARKELDSLIAHIMSSVSYSVSSCVSSI
ncbi:zeatin o-glucosyltransferase [Phtheirospermum japonicum]|uniref:Glycosyltransferase n=1 Tax=Phtheirospermum japonicum TaxID=374723 RepID=A0A830C760_9LAMI|nr:zeatin o-glucosyltransferase [Phtheirospermum japonicum]